MYKVVEGLYKDGKIVLSMFPDVKERTKVIVAFMEQPPQFEENAIMECDEIVLELPKNLDEVDVSVSTAKKYREQLTMASEKKMLSKGHSPFFTSLPVDIGYTDAGMLDKIVSGEHTDGNIS